MYRVIPLVIGTILLSFIVTQSRPAQAMARVPSETTGLDVDGNPIDRLIDRFGSQCPLSDEYLLASPIRHPACRLETEIAEFINGLPGNHKEMMDALGRIGVTCREFKKNTDCLYSKRIRITRSTSREAEPLDITDYTYSFRIRVNRGDEGLQPDVRVTITKEIIKAFDDTPNVVSPSRKN